MSRFCQDYVHVAENWFGFPVLFKRVGANQGLNKIMLVRNCMQTLCNNLTLVRYCDIMMNGTKKNTLNQ